jgi:quercetin dioxygenase-like cupin family protein
VTTEHPEGEGEALTARDTRSLVVKAEHELVDVTETWYGPGERGAEPHVHRHADAFYVLSGELTFVLGGALERRAAGVGTLVVVPPGVVHGFDNDARGDARFLNFHAPSRRFVAYRRAVRDRERVDPERFDIFDPPVGGGRPAEEAVARGPDDGETIAVGTNEVTIKQCFRDAAALPPGPPDPDVLAALAARHDYHVVTPSG